ncbi:hypothetical protein PAECIP111891_06014 [Paenibacillus allorhizoplanae]|uniref:Uncharacterized protein n=1 Tax=Paenibacillus allorhizoplanae TaxID=2905648 RepID=A0ABM9CYU2_9BACL|nr:hypothetical protein [Paenibacillus allorhizoplanae]CAH1226857.1 hypothetical protein PAECIP111891_06014 [Paenibacillus allorhizoplanae]
MYYYISIHSDDYTQKIKSEVLEHYLLSKFGFTKVGHLKFIKEINGETVEIMGIPANPNGGYAFNTLDGIEEVNLIEIDLPRYIDGNLEHSISEIAISIAKEFSWMIDDNHGLDD